MKLSNFDAESDLVGRRIRLSWLFILENDETLASIPPVVVRRKVRDFEFMPLTTADPTLVYDSTAFPPAGGILTEVPGWEVRNDSQHQVTQVETVAQPVNGQLVEVRRRTITITYDASNQPRSQQVELLDTGSFPGGLIPGTTYYYQISSPAIDAATAPAPYRATVTATDSYSLARTLYEMVPNVYRRHDVRTRPLTPGTEAMPEAATRSGQLRRFTDLFGVVLDNLRSSAEGLRSLQDIDQVDYHYLPLLARWIGWNLNLDTTIPVQRNEIKSASALYRDTGTIPNLRALVNYYTGWYSQVAEFVQSIARSNQPAQLNIFALQQLGNGWRSPDDAALVLGFTAGNQVAIGTATGAAILDSALTQPFALRSGMQLILSVDNGLPITIRFGKEDFVDIRNATAAEVSAVLNRLLFSAEAVPLEDGRLSLRTLRRGGSASLEVGSTNPELITLEGAPEGKLTPVLDGSGRLRLFYETMETNPDLLPLQPASAPPQRQIRYKAYDQGIWGDSIPFDPAASKNQGSPAAVMLPNGQVVLSWIEQPDTAEARIVTALGTARSPKPARLVGTVNQPFNIPSGSTLTLRRNHTTIQTITFQETDFALPQMATANEVATILNTRLSGIRATVQPNQSLLLETTGVIAEQLAVDLRLSTVARALGFGPRNSTSQGSWDDTLDWSPAVAVPGITAGRHADLHALQVGADTLWLFWAMHDGTAWQIMAVRRQETTWTTPIALTQGLLHNREPQAIVDGSDRIWLFWAQSQMSPENDDRWLLVRRVSNPATDTWSPPQSVTTLTDGGRARDREPGAVLLDTSTVRLFFRSDRAGSLDLWFVDVGVSDGVATAPQSITRTGEVESAPAPVLFPNGVLWLLYRSDQSLPLTETGIALSQQMALSQQSDISRRNLSPVDLAFQTSSSAQLSDSGTLRHFHGSTSIRSTDTRRNLRKRRWDDLLSYTPQQVEVIGKTGVLVGENFYTPNTVGIYISRTQRETALTPRKVERLRQVLEQAIPVNMRAVIILAPRVDVEYVYESGTLNDLRETYQDDYPFVEYYTGVLEQTGVRLPDWIVILSNLRDHISADPNNLPSLRRRSFFPPFN
jgi:phage tail-like protein